VEPEVYCRKAMSSKERFGFCQFSACLSGMLLVARQGTVINSGSLENFSSIVFNKDVVVKASLAWASLVIACSRESF